MSSKAMKEFKNRINNTKDKLENRNIKPVSRNVVEAHVGSYNVNIDTKGIINPKEVIPQLQDVLELCSPISDHIGKKIELSKVVDSTFDLMVNNICGNNISFSVC